MDYQLQMQIDDERLFDCLIVDKINRDRSTLDITKKKGYTLIDIKAKDATALRATFDGLVKLMAVYEKMGDLSKDAKRR